MSLTADEAFDSAVILGSNPSLSDDGSQAKTVWAELPDNLLLHIFCFLSPKEVLVAGEVCRNWHRLSKDELLWKYFLKDNLYNAAYSKNIELPNSSSWFAEFQRIHTKTPSVESQVLKEHTDEVLHVTFSHDGRLLASSSKDCYVILWSVDDCNCVSFERKINFRQHNWEYVQFCEFNANDTLLLVSGVAGKRRLIGEIVIYELQGSSTVDRNSNEPYPLFGAWLSERCYLSGTLEVIMEPAENGGRLWFSQLWANYVWKSPDNLTNKIQSKVARVVNHKSWSVTLVHVARPSISSQSTYASTALQGDDHGHACLIFTCGTASNAQSHQVMLKWLKLPHNLNRPGGLFLAALSETCINAHGQSDVKHTVSSHGQSDVKHAVSCEFCSRPDHCIETNAHIIGMTLSPDHQYLYMNCRPFRDGTDGEFGPDISNDISLQVYSLFTYELVGVYAGHQAYTDKYQCAFIFLDVANKLVASGAEDPCAHVWDRHFGAKLATLKGHSKVVNCVAFNPVNQEMLVSASDDHTIRVWKSRQLSRFKNDN